MTPVQQKLRALQHYGTRYEVRVTPVGTGLYYLLGYTGRKSKAGLVRAVTARGEALTTRTGCEAFRLLGTAKAPLVALLDSEDKIAFEITFSRTQRDAIVSGELTPFLP